MLTNPIVWAQMYNDMASNVDISDLTKTIKELNSLKTIFDMRPSTALWGLTLGGDDIVYAAPHIITTSFVKFKFYKDELLDIFSRAGISVSYDVLDIPENLFEDSDHNDIGESVDENVIQTYPLQYTYLTPAFIVLTKKGFRAYTFTKGKLNYDALMQHPQLTLSVPNKSSVTNQVEYQGICTADRDINIQVVMEVLHNLNYTSEYHQNLPKIFAKDSMIQLSECYKRRNFVTVDYDIYRVPNLAYSEDRLIKRLAKILTGDSDKFEDTVSRIAEATKEERAKIASLEEEISMLKKSIIQLGAQLAESK